MLVIVHRRLAGGAHALLPPVLFHRRQSSARRQLSGIRVDRLILIGFVIMGAAGRALAGVLGAARLNSAVVNAGVGIELQGHHRQPCSAAPASSGGEGTILGGMLGVLFIALIENAMIINAIGVFWQGIVWARSCCSPSSLDRFKTSGRAWTSRRDRRRDPAAGWTVQRPGELVKTLRRK